MADENIIQALVEPKKARPGRKPKGGSPTSFGVANSRWTLRGISTVTRSLAVEAAESRDMRIGDWVSEAIVGHFKNDREEGISADGTEKALADISDRLTSLEKEWDKGPLRRLFSRAKNILRRIW